MKTLIIKKVLLVVESPTKAIHLGKILKEAVGEGLIKDRVFTTFAVCGHFKDLPHDNLGITIKKNTFELEFVTTNPNIVKKLREKVARCDELYIATDPDREGEAIAHHIFDAVKDLILPEKVFRIRLYSITRKEILKAVQEKGKIDENLVKAQFTRRAIDRYVGYILSPHAKKTLNLKIPISVGRVQSPAVYFIVKRQEEIDTFIPQILYFFSGIFYPARLNGLSHAIVSRTDFLSSAEAKKTASLLSGKRTFTIRNISSSKEKIFPPPPFTTSSLQKEAFRAYGFSPDKTMAIARSLYEKGHCTYIRTDSCMVSEEGLYLAEEFISRHFGPHLLELNPYEHETETLHAQEAHECIRPLHLGIPDGLSNDEQRLFHLIKTRFIASQMKPAVAEVVKAEIVPYKEEKPAFYTEGRRIAFEGFLKIMRDKMKELEKNVSLFYTKTNQLLSGIVKPSKKRTQPPPNHSPATLIEELEKHGIGRPSTYEKIIRTIKNRGYVRGENKMKPTSLAYLLMKYLSSPERQFLIDPEFTSRIEKRLDLVAKGKEEPEKVFFEVAEMVDRACGKETLPAGKKTKKKKKTPHLSF